MTAPMKPTMVQLPKDMIEKLDRRAARRQVSRSALIREAVLELLSSDDEGVISEAYRDGYGRHPLDAEDGWGDLESFHQEIIGSKSGDGDRW